MFLTPVSFASHVRFLTRSAPLASKVRCVGECGLDYSEGFPSAELQLPWFERQVELACKVKNDTRRICTPQVTCDHLIIRIRRVHSMHGQKLHAEKMPRHLFRCLYSSCCVSTYTATRSGVDHHLIGFAQELIALASSRPSMQLKKPLFLHERAASVDFVEVRTSPQQPPQLSGMLI